MRLAESGNLLSNLIEPKPINGKRPGVSIAAVFFYFDLHSKKNLKTFFTEDNFIFFIQLIIMRKKIINDWVEWTKKNGKRDLKF